MELYTVTIGGVEHTMQLSEEDAKRYDAKPVAVKEAPAPKNKARGAKAKG